jgi:hypothetical protein
MKAVRAQIFGQSPASVYSTCEGHDLDSRSIMVPLGTDSVETAR